ncbi:MAG: galactosylceramidase [Tepidisphaeraceae bacterium]
MTEFTRRHLGSFLVSLCLFSLAASGPAWGDQAISIDGKREGRRFDGIGAVSGGGATSRLLIEYPEPQRSQILDYLFKPNFGASLQVLYVEIGSDLNGTQGSEPSHARSREEMDHPKPEYFERGYEWWLMKEARKRNPEICFDATAWNAPPWVGVGSGGFWSQDMCDYYVSWIKGAKTYHGLDVAYTGCRNESGVNIPWVKMYRKTLDKAGLNHVIIHAFDNWRPETKWTFAKEFATDPELRNAVGIIGNHVTWKGAPEGVSPSPDYVLNSDKPIWDTEEHVYQEGFPSAINKVRACNENYIDNKVTSTVFWHLISSFYSIEGWYGKHAMAIAASPWSGNYAMLPELWGHAHTCQFTKIGWKYLDGEGCGYFKSGGSYVTYKAANGPDYTIVIETKNAKADQSIAFNLTGGLSTGKVSVWNSDAAAMFQKQDDIAPQNGAVILTLKPSSIYTITTTTGQQKGAYPAPPVEKPFPFPYHENYDHYKKTGVLPYYHSDIHGVFEVVNRPDGKGKCAQATVKFARTKTPLDGFTVIGDAGWKDYQVSVDVSSSDGGSAALLGRVSGTRGKLPKGYILKLGADGAWTLLAAADTLASGQEKLVDQPWHNLKLVFEGTTIKACLDGKQVASVTNSTFTAGMAGLGTLTSAPCFDNLIINEVNGAAPPPTMFFQDDMTKE